MKAYVKILIIITVTFGLIVWIRNSFDFGHIAKTLPFCGGHEPGIYDFGAVALIVLMFWGFSRLSRDSETEDDTYEESYDDYEMDYDEYEDSRYEDSGYYDKD